MDLLFVTRSVSIYFIFIFSLLFTVQTTAQIGINTTDPKAMLDVESDDSGILIPRVSLVRTTDADPVVSPQHAELVFNLATVNDVTPGFYYWNGSIWVRLSAGGGSTGGDDDKWDLSGNSGTTPGDNFLGTKDNNALHIKTANTTRLIFPTENQIHANSNGTQSKPFYSFAGNEGSKFGMFLFPSQNLLGFSAEGERKFFIGKSRIMSLTNHEFMSGNKENPGIYFNYPGSPKTGIFSGTPTSIGFSTAEEEKMQINNDGVSIKSSISFNEGPNLTLQNGVNDVNPGSTGTTFSQYRITGPTAAFSIKTISPISGADGQIITLINTTNYPLTLIHNHTSSTVNARIFCPTESNFVLNGRYATVTLQYNKTLAKWVITDFADGGGSTPASNNITSVKGTTNASTNLNNFTDMQQMTITFTPQNPMVYVSFSASGYMDVNIPMVRGGGASFRLINVTAGNRVEAGLASLTTDYNMDMYGNEHLISAWNASLNMFPVSVTPGVPTTLKIQWARDAAHSPKTLRCDVASDPSGAHRVLTVLD